MQIEQENQIKIKSDEGFVDLGNGVIGIPPSNTNCDCEEKNKKCGCNKH